MRRYGRLPSLCGNTDLLQLRLRNSCCRDQWGAQGKGGFGRPFSSCARREYQTSGKHLTRQRQVDQAGAVACAKKGQLPSATADYSASRGRTNTTLTAALLRAVEQE